MNHSYMDRPRILVSAFACDPNMGSEPYVGWNWPLQIADDFRVHVLTRTHHRHSIRAADTGRIRYHYMDLPGFTQKDHRSPGIKMYYILWQIAALPFALALHVRYRFAVIHHLTYNVIDYPGFLWLLPRSAFLWGPVGGGQIPPASLAAVYSNWTQQRARAALKAMARFNPLVQLASRRAYLVLCANEETCRRLPETARARSQLFLETGLKDLEAPPSRNREHLEPFRLLWVGVLEERKAPLLAFDVVTELRRRGHDVEITFVGDGPMRSALAAKASSSSADGHTTIRGQVPHDEVPRLMGASDALLFTSVQDTSGNVVLEALSTGLPVIALRHQGPKAILNGQEGGLVPVGTYDAVVHDFVTRVTTLANDRSAWRSASSEAYQTAGRHTWRSRRETIVEFYRPTKDQGVAQVD